MAYNNKTSQTKAYMMNTPNLQTQANQTSKTKTKIQHAIYGNKIHTNNKTTIQITNSNNKHKKKQTQDNINTKQTIKNNPNNSKANNTIKKHTETYTQQQHM